MAGVTSTIRRGHRRRPMRASAALAARAERVIDQHGAPRLLRQQRRGHLLVGTRSVVRAPQRCSRRASSEASIAAGATISMIVAGQDRAPRTACVVAVAGARQRHGRRGMSSRAPGALSTRDAAAHALDDALGNGQPEPGAADICASSRRRPARIRERCAPGPRPRCRCRCRAPG